MAAAQVLQPADVAVTDVAVTDVAEAPVVTAGGTAAFIVTVGNNGPMPATNVVLTDTLPPGFRSVVTVSEARGYDSQAVSCSVAGDVATCPIGNLAVGQTPRCGSPDRSRRRRQAARCSPTRLMWRRPRSTTSRPTTTPPLPSRCWPSRRLRSSHRRHRPPRRRACPPTGAEIAGLVRLGLLFLLTGAVLVFFAFRGRDIRRRCEDELRLGRYHRR